MVNFIQQDTGYIYKETIMKKERWLLVIIATIIFGFVLSPIFDDPSGYTTYYSLRMWDQGDNPSADSLNQNWIDTDSLFNDLVVYTDPLQMSIGDDTLKFVSAFGGLAAFTATDSLDTLVITGIDSLDVFLISARESGPLGQLWAEVNDDTVFVSRSDSTVSGLKYNYIWVRRYQ